NMEGKNSKKKHNNRLIVNDTNIENSVNDPVQEPLNTHSNISGMNQDDSLNQAKPFGLTNREMCPVPSFQNSYSNVILYIALYDYEKRANDEITIHEGDTLYIHILNKDYANWWWASHTATHEQGYVPENFIAVVDSLDSNPLFFGNIKRSEANRCLMLPANEIGSFLVRDSMAPTYNGEPTPYSLSVRFGANIKTYRIGKRGNTWYVTFCPGIVFNSVQDLINFFKLNQGLCCYLGKPCIQPEKPSTAGLSHSDKWELDKSAVKFIKNIGSGQFGEVYEGIASNVRVAMKTLKPGTMEPESFLAEAVLMKKLLHKNLIQLYAVCTLDEPIYIITEFMVNGDLLNYLRYGEGKYLNENILIDISAQISTGMRYLEENSFIHRDLAAQNVLVGVSNIVKVADFGLTRLIEDDVYTTQAGAKFPVKWTSPEVISFSRYTIKSDVWSYGILLHEIISKGKIPYPGLSNKEVTSLIDSGYRMSKDQNCPQRLYDMMLRCWNPAPQERPTFQALTWELEDYYTTDNSSGYTFL
ncbi:unnamed protein product, partial [Meganyctiphanes norvegica]